MTDALIQAEYADYKRVKGRKVLQLICEVPIEQAPTVHKMLGEPAFGERQINVAIARLDPTAAKPEPGKPKGKSYAQNVALTCQEGAFWKFLNSTNQSICHVHDQESAAISVRDFCRVSSRSEIIDGTEAGRTWLKLRGMYLVWLKQ